MSCFDNILEAVGNTPLIKINKLTCNLKPTILAKAEFLNPGGSIKDRISIQMVMDAEKNGALKKGSTIIEATGAGNTGIGLAIAATLKGYKTIFTMPDKASKEKESLLRAFGAEVIRCPTDVSPEDPRSYYKAAEKIAKNTPNTFYTMQYYNASNPAAHYRTTGPEIWKDTNGKVTHLVAGIGTGGTISGTAKYLKEKNPNIKVIAPDPEGSIFHHKFYETDGEMHTYKIEGIGEDFIPGTVDLSLVDEIKIVSDKEAYKIARELAEKEALLVGSSSGAAVHVALEIAKDLDESNIIVVILPDTGRNYLSTIFNDEWMKQNGFL